MQARMHSRNIATLALLARDHRHSRGNKDGDGFHDGVGDDGLRLRGWRQVSFEVVVLLKIVKFKTRHAVGMQNETF